MSKSNLQKEQVLITVAMVTYNSEKFISEAIESILSSTYKNWELFICDDQSKDRTAEIVEKYILSDHRIKLHVNTKNLGEYPNRNQCLEKASGDYIIYIDGDDKIYPHALETYAKHALQFPYCSMIISRPHDFRYFYPHTLTSYEAVYNHYLGNTVLNMALVRVFFKVKVLKELGGFSTKYKSGDDYVRLLMACHTPILLIQDGLVWWRKSPGQASEKLLNSYSRLIEPLQIKTRFLQEISCPLNEVEKNRAKLKLKQKYQKLLLSLIKRLKFNDAGRLYADGRKLFK